MHKFIHSMQITDFHDCHNHASHEAPQEISIISRIKLIPAYPSFAHALITGFCTALSTGSIEE
jgi:hypothetical protein